MAQKIVTLCDVHARQDEEVAGALWTVSIQGPGDTKPSTWEVDLCADDSKTLADLAIMLGAVGRQTEGPRRKAAARASQAATGARTAPQEAPEAARVPDGSMVPAPCPVEGCDAVLAHRSSLAVHLRRMHDTTLGVVEGAPTPHACPDCEFASTAPQGLAAHRRQVHGVKGARAEEHAAAS